MHKHFLPSATFTAATTYLSLQGIALAQTAEPLAPAPATAALSEAVPAPDVSARSWRNDYTVARERLLAGDFVDAADRFEALAVDPHASPADRALAVTMRDLARSWDDRGLALVKRNDLGESGLPARAVNERTTDEIAQLYVASVLYGVGGGLWIDEHTQPSSGAGVILPILLFSGAAAGSVALLDIGHPLHYGVAQSAVSGLYLGFEAGLLLSLWNQSRDSWQGSTVADVIWAFSTIGAVGGGVLGTTLGATPGRASFVGSTGLWGGVLAGFAAAAFSNSNTASSSLLAANVGLGAGTLAGLLAAGPASPSIARVRFLDLGGIVGGLLGGGLYLVAANNSANAQAAFGTTALGVATGLGVAWVATWKMPADRPDERAKAASVLEPMLLPVRGGAALGVMGVL